MLLAWAMSKHTQNLLGAAHCLSTNHKALNSAFGDLGNSDPIVRLSSFYLFICTKCSIQTRFLAVT